MPLTELSESISGRRCQSKAQISIFINQKKRSRYKAAADDSGTFRLQLENKRLSPGDLIWVRQSKNGQNSKFSPAYSVIDTKLVSWYSGKEKEIISSLQNITNILLSWSVIIIGGFIYLIIKEGRRLQLLFLLIPIFFLFILSIYYGFSCNSSLISALSNSIPVSKHPSIDTFWWKHIELFQQAIFLSAIFVLWNMPHTNKKSDLPGGE